MSGLDDKLRDILKHYYLYMKQCEIAGDSKISHTTVKTAITDANEFTGSIITQIKQAFADQEWLDRFHLEITEAVKRAAGIEDVK